MYMKDTHPSLLTKGEIRWLTGESKPSKGYEAVMRHAIRQKLQTFEKLELPLLVRTGFVANPSISTGANSISTGTNSMLELRGASGGISSVSDAFGPATSTLPR